MAVRTSQIERRVERREIVDRSAIIYLGKAGSSLCKIENASRWGAKLHLLTSKRLPLLVELEDVFGVRRRARLVWLRARRAGIYFTDRAPYRRSRDFGQRKL